MKYLRLLSLLMCVLALTLTSCSGDDKDGNTGPEKPVLPSTDITVDANSNLYGLISDKAGEPIEGVVVSDGFQCVTTNVEGVYQMVKNENAEFVFYSTPSEYQVEVSKINSPTFFAKINKSKPKFRQDFTLTALDKPENDFTLICIGDPQCKSTHTNRFKNETMAALKKTVSESSLPCYGLTMGDIVYDEPDVMTTMRTLLGAATMPIFNTPGNHDDSEIYKTVFGPLDFSFNRGKVHFVSMNNVIFSGDDYTAVFLDSQVEWLKQDLSNVSKDRMVILFYHIPLRSSNYKNRATVLGLLKDYAQVHLMAGHTHYAENYINDADLNYMYEHIHAAACGAWWFSDINGDGAPNGYAIYDVRGAAITNGYYKPTHGDKNHQIRLHRGHDITGGSYEKFNFSSVNKAFTANTVVANVWNADKGWKVQLFEDGVLTGDMKLLGSVNDLWSVGYHVGVVGRGHKSGEGTGGTPGGSRSSYLTACKHLYYLEPKSLTSTIKVVATDQWGNSFEETKFTAGTEYSEAKSPN